MLVLALHVNGSVFINGPCEIKFIKIHESEKGKSPEIRLAFNAPQSTRILRSQLMTDDDLAEMATMLKPD
jgi:sRNA-binding carbon storage regulator CsrA